MKLMHHYGIGHGFVVPRAWLYSTLELCLLGKILLGLRLKIDMEAWPHLLFFGSMDFLVEFI